MCVSLLTTLGVDMKLNWFDIIDTIAEIIGYKYHCINIRNNTVSIIF